MLDAAWSSWFHRHHRKALLGRKRCCTSLQPGPWFSTKQATCTGRLLREAPLAVAQFSNCLLRLPQEGNGQKRFFGLSTETMQLREALWFWTHRAIFTAPQVAAAEAGIAAQSSN